MSFVYRDSEQKDQIVKVNHLRAKANEFEHYQELECIKPLFVADSDEVEAIQQKWLDHLQANKQDQLADNGLQLNDLVLNINFVQVEDNKDFQIRLRSVRCKICYGLTRLPGKFCSMCRRIYCKACIDQESEKKGESFVCPNPQCMGVSFYDLTDEMEEFIKNLIFVQC